MSADHDKEYQGLAAFDKQGEGGTYALRPYTYPHKKFAPDDVEVKVEASGICGSDLHTIREGWGLVNYPAVVGHEIVGRITRLGADVKGLAIGQRVGFGAQAGACMKCEECTSGWENLCADEVGTYQGMWEDCSVSQGGYSSHYMGKWQFAIPIPDALPSDEAAPLLCAGITTYSPLKNHGIGPGKRVAVVGIGGLGHLGLQWAVALGADTYALSSSEAKKADCEKMGVQHFVVSSDMPAITKKYTRFFDFIMVTSSMNGTPITEFTDMLKPRGTLCLVALPEEPLPPFDAKAIAGKNAAVVGSHIGPPAQIAEMLQFAADKGVRTWVERRPLTVEGVNQALADVAKNKARYRCVLIPQ